jgi:hypothetical protein
LSRLSFLRFGEDNENKQSKSTPNL